MAEPRDPVADLRRIAFLLERAHEATYRVRAFRTAAAVLAARDDVAQRVRAGTLTELPGVGEVIARCVTQSLTGQRPEYLQRLEATADAPLLTMRPRCGTRCVVTATRTRTGPMAAPRSTRWRSPPASSATTTWY